MGYAFLVFVSLSIGFQVPTQVHLQPALFQDRSKTESRPLQLACSTEKAVVFEGETVILRAWAPAPDDKEPSYEWAADAGRIVGRGHEVQWDFAGVHTSLDPFQATVHATVPSGESGSCSVAVFVMGKDRGTAETGRSFLVKGRKEESGYGLYSYLLFGSRPDDSNRDRYLKAIDAYLKNIEEVSKLQVCFPRSKLNVAYLPLEVAPGPSISADWLLNHYDYVRARALLDVLPRSLREGPYIVSALRPLGNSSAGGQYLFQDLSAVPSKNGDLISWWVREFIAQAAQEHFWEPRTAELFVLKMRTTIGVLATGLPEVQKSLEGWISWIH